jgi:hypothetical protein
MTVLARPELSGIVRPPSWVIPLQPGLFLLNDNQRLNKFRKADHISALRGAAIIAARQAKAPRLERAHIFYVVHPATKGRRRDPGNWSPSAKAAVDGLVEAGLLPDDNSSHLLGPDPRLGPVVPGSQLVLIVTDLTAMDPAHLALLNPPSEV